MAEIDPLITAYIQLQISPDAVKNVEGKIDELAKSLERLKAVKIDFALSEKSRQALNQVETLARALQGLSTSGGNIFRGAAQAARALGAVQKSATGALSETDKAFQAQFTAAERSFAKRLAASEFLLGNRKTARPTQEDFFAGRDAENAKRRTAEDDAFLANVLKNATDDANLSRQRFLTSLKQESKALREEAKRLAEVSFASGERDTPDVRQADVDRARANLVLIDRQKLLAQEAAEMGRLQKEAGKYIQFWVKASRLQEISIAKKEAKEVEKLQQEVQKYEAWWAKAIRQQEISAAKEEAKEVKKLQREAERYEAFWAKALRQQEMSAAKEEAKELERLNKEAEKYTDFWERSIRLQEVAANKLKAVIAQQELLSKYDKRSVSLAQQFANRRFLRGTRTTAAIQPEDLRRAERYYARIDAAAAKSAASARRSKSIIDAQLAAQDSAFKRQAQAFATSAFVSGRRDNENITQRDIDLTVSLRELEQQRADAAANTQKQLKLQSDQLKVQRELTIAQFNAQVRASAELRARRQFSRGLRSTAEVTDRDLAIAARLDRARKAAAQRQLLSEKRIADERSVLLRRYNAEEKRLAQRRADNLFNRGQRPEPIFNAQDLDVARKIYKRIKENTQALKDQAAAARELEAANRKAAAALERANRRAAAALARSFKNLNQKIGGAFTSTTQDLGFLFPQGQFVGNILRIGYSWSKVGDAIGDVTQKSLGLSGAVGSALKGFGGLIGFGLGGVLGGIAKAFSVVLSVVTRVAAVIGRIAFSVAAAGFRLLLAPTLAVVRAFRTLIAYGPQLAVALGIGLAQTLTNSAIQIERLRNLFDQAFLGQGGAQFEALRKRADAMGISFEQAAEPMARLAFAAKSAGLEARATDNLFQGISNAAVALKLDSDRLGRAFTAFEQILSKGRVSSEELRGQLAEAIPGIVPIVQRSLRLTGKELDQLLEKGQLTSNELIKALGPELQRAFQGGAAANANSLAAQVARIDNAFLRLKATLGAEIAPSFLRIKKALVDLAGSPQVLGFLRAVARRIAELFDLLRTSPAVQRFGELLAEAFRRLLPFVERIVSKILTLQAIANGTLLDGFIRLADYAIPKIDAALERVMEKVRELTGMSIFNAEDGLSFINVLLTQASSIKNIYLAVFDYLKSQAKATLFDFLYVGGAVAVSLAAVIKDNLAGVLEEAIFGGTKRSELKSLDKDIRERENGIKNLEALLANPKSRKSYGGLIPGEADITDEQIRGQIAAQKAAINAAKTKQKVLVEEIVKEEANNYKDAYNKYGPLITKASEGIGFRDELEQKELAQKEANIRKEFQPLLGAFETAKFENKLNRWVQAIKSAAEKAVDAVKPLTSFADNLGAGINSLFGRFGNVIGNAVTGLLGPLGNLLGGRAQPFGQQAKLAANAFIDFGQKFLSEAVKGGKPFGALGGLFSSLAKLGTTLPNIPGAPNNRSALQQETERIQSQFLDAESLFQSMQAQEQLKEQRKTNEELAMLRQEVKRGNDLAAARIPSGMMLDTRMRGAIA